MSTLAVVGLIQRSDTIDKVDLMAFIPTMAVDEDSLYTVDIGPSNIFSVPMGAVTTAKFVAIVSSIKLSVAMVSSTGTVTGLKGTHILVNDSDITSIELTNTSSTTKATVRILIGGA